LRRTCQELFTQGEQDEPRSSNRAYRALVSALYQLAGTQQGSLLLTVLTSSSSLQLLELRPRRHAKQHHLSQRPDMVSQPRRHCQGTRPPASG